MGVKAENIWAFLAGVHPNATAINSSGASTQDGSEFIAEYINNFIVGPWQALFDYASVTPNGITEAAGASQYLESIQKGHAIGPGTYRQWGKFDDPATTGDRLLLLSEQGVLIATYPELDAECYVGDATNAAVAAAGGKFYRSSDSGGATPNIAGPYLQLPANNPTFLKQYSEANGDFTVTGTDWTTTRAVAVLYQTSDGVWRLRFNIFGDLSLSANDLNLTFSGVTFKNIAGYYQAVTLTQKNATTTGQSISEAQPNTSIIRLAYTANTGSGGLGCSGDVELDSKPIWADDFSFPWGIVY